MDKKLFSALVESMKQMNEVVRGKRPPPGSGQSAPHRNKQRPHPCSESTGRRRRVMRQSRRNHELPTDP